MLGVVSTACGCVAGGGVDVRRVVGWMRGGVDAWRVVGWMRGGWWGGCVAGGGVAAWWGAATQRAAATCTFHLTTESSYTFIDPLQFRVSKLLISTALF